MKLNEFSLNFLVCLFHIFHSLKPWRFGAIHSLLPFIEAASRIFSLGRNTFYIYTYTFYIRIPYTLSFILLGLHSFTFSSFLYLCCHSFIHDCFNRWYYLKIHLTDSNSRKCSKVLVFFCKIRNISVSWNLSTLRQNLKNLRRGLKMIGST